MFGHHKLYKDGVPARSVIVGLRVGVQDTAGHSKQDYFVDGDQIPFDSPDQKVFFDVVARVEFGDGSTAEHAERLWRHQVGVCHVGDVLPVRHDQHHHDKIVFDLPELEAGRYSPKERADGQPPASLSYPRTMFPPAAGPGAFPQAVGPDAVRELLSELTADPQAFAAHIRQMAQEAGTNTFTFTSTNGPTGAPTPIQHQSVFPQVDFTTEETEDI